MKNNYVIKAKNIKEKKIKRVILITGSSGFIGFHLSKHFLLKKWMVIGLDAMTDYYDINLKKSRLKLLEENIEFHSYIGLIQDKKILNEIFLKYNPKIIIHLAAQAGVRYSIENPISYVESNLVGTFHLLEIAKEFKPNHLLMASTSSVYGNNKDIPFHENLKCDNPLSFYAATKKSNELMAHSYSHLYNIPVTMFRFFTVYGPWGRPDMALFKFTKNILSDKPIDVYNHGNMFRDFTFINDLVKAVYLLTQKIPLNQNKRKQTFKNDSISDIAPFRIVNIGNSQVVKLIDFISELENVLGKKAKKKFLEMQNGDVYKTLSNSELLEDLTGFRAKTCLREGISAFVDWYKSYY